MGHKYQAVELGLHSAECYIGELGGVIILPPWIAHSNQVTQMG